MSLTFEQWIDAWDLNVRIDETGKEDPNKKYYVEVWDDNGTASIYGYGNTEQEAKDNLVKAYGSLPNDEEVKCRYCGHISEDKSGVCHTCFHKYEDRG